MTSWIFFLSFSNCNWDLNYFNNLHVFSNCLTFSLFFHLLNVSCVLLLKARPLVCIWVTFQKLENAKFRKPDYFTEYFTWKYFLNYNFYMHKISFIQLLKILFLEFFIYCLKISIIQNCISVNLEPLQIRYFGLISLSILFHFWHVFFSLSFKWLDLMNFK